MLAADRVITLVRDAFADVPAPSPNEIAHCEQCELFVSRFLGRLPSDWRQIADEDLGYHVVALRQMAYELLNSPALLALIEA